MTGNTVNLAAVRDARDQLAAIVAAHPELTQPAARDRLAAALRKELDPMSKRLDPNASGASTTVGVRLSPDLLARVDAEVARLSALVPSATFGRSEAVRAMILRAVDVGPVQPTGTVRRREGTGNAPRPSAAAVDGNIHVEPLRAALHSQADEADEAPVVALHNAANGANVATVVSNDNAASTPKPKRARGTVKTADVNVVDLDALKVRLAAAVAAGHTLKALSRDGKFSDSSVVMWRNGRRASLGPEVAAKLDAVVTSRGF